MNAKILFSALAALGMMSFGHFAQAQDEQAQQTADLSAQAELAPQANSVLMIEASTNQIVRVDQAGVATPVSAEEMQSIVAQDQAAQATEATELWGHWGGHGGWGHGGGWGHRGWGGWHRGGGFWGGGHWGGGYWHHRGGGDWAPYRPCRWRHFRHYCY